MHPEAVITIFPIKIKNNSIIRQNFRELNVKTSSFLRLLKKRSDEQGPDHII